MPYIQSMHISTVPSCKDTCSWWCSGSDNESLVDSDEAEEEGSEEEEDEEEEGKDWDELEEEAKRYCCAVTLVLLQMLCFFKCHILQVLS